MAREQADGLRAALDRRRAILLRHQHGRSIEEVGRLQGRSPQAARKLWGRAALLLPKELQNS